MTEVNKDLVKIALSKLSADNDNHWTADGKPKIETIKMFSQGQAVDRAYLDAEFPDFNRTNTTLDQEKDTETDDLTQEEIANAGGVTQPITEGGDNATVEGESQESTVETGTEGDGAAPAVDGVLGTTFQDKADALLSAGYDSGDSLSVSLLHAVDEAIDALGSEPTQEDVDKVVHQIHTTQQALLGRLKLLDAQSARTAGQVKRESHASLMRKMRESHGTETKVEQTVEVNKYAVDNPRNKQPLR